MKTEMTGRVGKAVVRTWQSTLWDASSQSYTLGQADSFNPGLLNLGTTDIPGWQRLWGCPVHCRAFGSTPDLHPLDVDGTPSHNNQKDI